MHIESAAHTLLPIFLVESGTEAESILPYNSTPSHLVDTSGIAEVEEECLEEADSDLAVSQ